MGAERVPAAGPGLERCLSGGRAGFSRDSSKTKQPPSLRHRAIDPAMTGTRRAPPKGQGFAGGKFVQAGAMQDLCPSRPARRGTASLAVPGGTALQGSGKAPCVPRAVPSVEVIPG